MNLYVDLLNTSYYQENLFNMLGMRIVILDSNFNEISFYPDEHSHSAFCEYIRSLPQGYKRCMQCDNEGLVTTQKMRMRHCYCCHAGLTEEMSPILHGDTIIGYVVLGQFLDGDVTVEENWNYVFGKCSEFTDISDKRELFNQLPRITGHQRDACINILESILSMQYIAPFKNTEYEALQVFIAQNLENEISLNSVADATGMAPSKVRSLLKKYSAMTLNEYVQTARIEKSKELLKDSSIAIYEVADRCGIPDYNYFSRIFRKREGVSPSEYRKSYAKVI